MIARTRRGFLADVGRGMLAASIGSATALELGLSPARADEGPDRLTFGALEPLTALMQDTPAEQLVPLLASKLAAGTDLKTMIAAGALANARTFGGQDYTGYHALMALAPAHAMAMELPEDRRALPVLKVLHRNTRRIQEQGGRKNEVLKPIRSEERNGRTVTGEQLQQIIRKTNVAEAEFFLADMTDKSVGDAFHNLQPTVHDDFDVHRVVLAWRAWALLDFTGQEQASTLLRQSVRFCVQSERDRIEKGRAEPGIRVTLPKLLDQYKLIDRPLGDRQPDDRWVENLAQQIYSGTREKAAEAVAAALAEGMNPEAIGEAISLAAARLVLHDPGRVNGDAEKPKGSVHGASVGVHASDSANAWRNIARVGNRRDATASLIVGGYHTAGQSNGLNPSPYPYKEQLEVVKENDPAKLLRMTEEAVRAKDQPLACAIVHQYGERGGPTRPLFDLLLGFAVSEDGALHAEKYYRTVCEEFANTRASLRWRHLVALARVTASEYGHPSPGYQAACRVLHL
jgi:hypothetical protein